jgi:hypothetical protein
MPKVDDEGVDTTAYNRWHFYPYTDAPEYQSDSPLYAFVAGVEGRGEIIIYARTPSDGAFHSADPDYAETTPHPPSDDLKNAFAALISNPNETVDISSFIGGMEPWEHHFVEYVMGAISQAPEKVPDEIWEFLNRSISSQLQFELEEDEEDKHPHGGVIQTILENPEKYSSSTTPGI